MRVLTGSDGYRNPDTGRNHCVIANIKMRVVNCGKGKVYVRIFTQAYVFSAPVSVKWCLDIAIFVRIAKHFLSSFSRFFCCLGEV